MKKVSKPLRLLTSRQLRFEYGLSWHKVQRRVDRGEVVPFAFFMGAAGNAVTLFHPNQVPELVQTCKNRPRKSPWVADELSKKPTTGDLSAAPQSCPLGEQPKPHIEIL